MSNLEVIVGDEPVDIPEGTIKIIQEFCSQPHIFDKIVEYQKSKDKELKEA